MQAAFHIATCLGLLFFYHPTRRSDYPKMSVKQVLWACDPIGSFLFIVSATLLLLALDWAGGSYTWSDAHVAAPLAVGFVLLAMFCLYGKSSLADYQQILIKFFRMERAQRWSCRPCLFQGLT